MNIEKMLKDKRLELNSLRTEAASIEREIDKLTRRLQDEKIQEVTDELAAYTGGLNLVPIRNTLVGENTASDLEGVLDGDVCLIGHGPWDEEEFQEFLLARDFNVLDPDDHFGVLIVGRSIDEDEMIALRSVLDYHIDSGEPLVVVSQELLVLGLIQLINPLEDLSEDELRDLAEGHGGLTTVIGYEGFSWPFVADENDDDDDAEDDAIYEFDSSELSAESPLHRVGYTVAEGRLSVSERRAFLREMYEIDGDDVYVTDDEYRVWGNARTQQRLYAMARHISWLIGFRGETAPNAAERWRSDLDWLKVSYYRPNMRFSWPVGQSPKKPVGIPQGKDKLASTWPFPGSR